MRTKLLFLLLLLGCGDLRAAVIRMAVGSTAEQVQAKINEAGTQIGDTILLPAGDYNWTGQLTISKAITLQGETTVNSSAVPYTASDQTIITKTGTFDTLMIVKPPATTTDLCRVTGITFKATTGSNNGFISFSGQSHLTRIDHCHFPTIAAAIYIKVSGNVYGIADHNWIETTGAQVFYGSNGSGPNESYGHLTYSQPTGNGGPNWFFIEDNYIRWSGGGDLMDGSSGLKFCIRHNHLYNCDFANHGTEGAARGGRALDIYKNDIHYDAGGRGFLAGVRSGTVLFWGNTWSAEGAKSSTRLNGGFALAVYRLVHCWSSQEFVGFEGASGRCPWDVNVTEANGTYVEGHTPWQFYPANAPTLSSSSAAAETTGSYGGDGHDPPQDGGIPIKIVSTVTPSPLWTADQWRLDYGVYSVEDGKMGRPTGNTANGTITFANPATFTTGAKDGWVPGNHYQIYKPLVALDQESRGQGDLLSGVNGQLTNTVTGSRSWPHQILEPVYSWDNHEVAAANKAIGVQSGYPQMKENRDWFNQAPAVTVGGVSTQLTGVGVGVFASRPAAGVNGVDVAGVTANPPGTAYWSTNTASINGSSDQGALYVWRGGAWSLYYQPYTYPHPCVTNPATCEAGGVATPVITSTSATFTIGVAGTFTFQQQNFTTAPNLWESATALPTGLSIAPTTGILSGTTSAAAGQYHRTISATNTGTLETASTDFIINIVANAPPTVSITAPTNGQSFLTTDNPVTVSATASATGTVTQVQFKDNDSTTGFAPDTTAPYSVSHTFPAGPHSLTAVATDNLGISTTSSAVSITMATPPPTTTPTPPATVMVLPTAPISVMKPPPKGTYLFTSGYVTASNPPATSAGEPGGVPNIDKANCDGVRWLAKWSDIETSAGVYNWAPLDAAVLYATNHNKLCGISVNAGWNSPAWLYAAPYNAVGYVLQDTGFYSASHPTMPTVGDPVFLARWEMFIKAFGERYDSNRTVSFIDACGIGADDQWNIDGPLDTAALGNTLAKVTLWKNTAKAVIDFTMTAFPTTTVENLVRGPFNTSNAGEDPVVSMQEVGNYASAKYGCQWGYGVAPLVATTTAANFPPANEIFTHWTTNDSHCETDNPATSISDLAAELQRAIELKVRCVELYKADFQNATFQSTITSARATILGIPECPVTP